MGIRRERQFSFVPLRSRTSVRDAGRRPDLKPLAVRVTRFLSQEAERSGLLKRARTVADTGSAGGFAESGLEEAKGPGQKVRAGSSGSASHFPADVSLAVSPLWLGFWGPSGPENLRRFGLRSGLSRDDQTVRGRFWACSPGTLNPAAPEVAAFHDSLKDLSWLLNARIRCDP